MPKVETSLGVTAGIFDIDGRILLVRRKGHTSITGIDYFGCWELPVVAVQKSEENISYNYLVQELKRGVLKKTGCHIRVDPMPAFYPVIFKNKKTGEYDLAMITIIEAWWTSGATQSDIELIFVDVQDANKLAQEYAPPVKNERGEIID